MGNFSCNMNNAVYCLSCTKCPSTVYIGETGCGLADHFREHRRDVSNGRNHLPVPAHSNQANYTQEDMKAGVLDAGLANQEYSNKQEMRLIFFLMGLWVLLALIKTFFFNVNYSLVAYSGTGKRCHTKRKKGGQWSKHSALQVMCDGTSALSALLVCSKVGEIFCSFANQFDPDNCITPFCTCFITQPLSALLSHVARVQVCNQARASPVPQMYTVD